MCTGVAVGVVSSSSIKTPITRERVSDGTPYHLKRIGVIMLKQEYELFTGKLGMLFGFKSIAGDYAEPETGFVTRPSVIRPDADEDQARRRTDTLFFNQRKNLY